jgi:hypothetical protein
MQRGQPKALQERVAAATAALIACPLLASLRRREEAAGGGTSRGAELPTRAPPTAAAATAVSTEWPAMDGNSGCTSPAVALAAVPLLACLPLASLRRRDGAAGGGVSRGTMLPTHAPPTAAAVAAVSLRQSARNGRRGRSSATARDASSAVAAQAVTLSACPFLASLRRREEAAGGGTSRGAKRPVCAPPTAAATAAVSPEWPAPKGVSGHTSPAVATAAVARLACPSLASIRRREWVAGGGRPRGKELL